MRKCSILNRHLGQPYNLSEYGLDPVGATSQNGQERSGERQMHLGQHMTDEQKANCRRAQIKSPETKAKLSAALMGHPVSPRTREKVATANRLRKVSLETRAKRSAALKGRIKSPEWQAKISVALWKGGLKVSQHKSHAKHRTLGYVPLNAPFVGCVGHHVDPEQVINMPRSLHRSIYHRQDTGQGMAQMNAIAYNYLFKQEVEAMMPAKEKQ